MANSRDHAERIKQELRKAGVSRLGFLRFAIRYLPNLIHPSEHIGGVVYGRYKEAEGTPAWEEGLLVATDRRVLFVDHKPGFLKSDEMSYEVVSGIRSSRAGLFSSITLYSKIGDFTILFARNACVQKFVRYVENRRLETSAGGR